MRLTGVLVLVLVLGLAACGGSSGGGGGGGGGGTQQAASSGGCPSGTVVIHMRNIQFDPTAKSVKVGQQVCWVNDDDVQHDVEADNGLFSSALFGKDHHFTTKLTKAGEISYVCTVHPNMTAKLQVKP
jgi:plastocyanin